MELKSIKDKIPKELYAILEKEITYVNINPDGVNLDTIVGDYTEPPFGDKQFDALFFQDNHANRTGVRKMMKNLRINGIIIFSSYQCQRNIPLEQFEQLKGVERIDTPFLHRDYTVFQKVGEVSWYVFTPTQHE